MNNKAAFLNLLGFAQKAGKIVSGDAAVNALILKNQLFLLIIAEDISENRKKHWGYVANQEGLPLVVIGTKIDLGIAIGLSPRAVVGVTDGDMAKSLLKKI